MGEWQSIEEMDVFRELERLSDEVWERVSNWSPLAQDTVGKQLVCALDSIGANLVEGDGRYTYRDKLNYCYIARGSLKETCYWIRRVQQRSLLQDDVAHSLLQRLERIQRWLNALITQRRQ